MIFAGSAFSSSPSVQSLKTTISNIVLTFGAVLKSICARRNAPIISFTCFIESAAERSSASSSLKTVNSSSDFVFLRIKTSLRISNNSAVNRFKSTPPSAKALIRANARVTSPFAMNLINPILSSLLANPNKE